MSKYTDSYQRAINIGDIVFWSGRLCVIRAFGKTGLPHVTYRCSIWNGHEYVISDIDSCIRKVYDPILKIEDVWLMDIPAREEIGELMRIRHEILTKTYAKKTREHRYIH